MKKLGVVTLLITLLFFCFVSDSSLATPTFSPSPAKQPPSDQSGAFGDAISRSRTQTDSTSYSIFLPSVTHNYIDCDHIIGRTVSVADARSNYSDVKPGSTVCIAAGSRGDLLLRNFQGTAESPITFINFEGQVVIDSDTSHGILIQNSRFFRLTGTGITGLEYGIKIIHSTNAGVQIGYKSSDFEIAHIEVGNVGGAGFSAKTKATCSDGSTNDYDYDADGNEQGDLDDVVNRDIFTQYNSVFHNNYVHNVGSVAFYIGSSFYMEGREVSCRDGSETVYDPVIEGVSVYDNKVTDTGSDGIQVGSAIKNCNIHHNVILRDSQDNKPSQQSGVMNNPGSVCNIYNNLIQDGGGPGIYVQGHGGNIIFNNVIVNAGQNKPIGSNGGDGIVVFNGSNPGSSIYILNNTIVTPKNFGVKFVSDKGSDNRIQNNIIVAPGNYDSYGQNAYIQTSGRDNVTVSNNLISQNSDELRFTDPDSNDYSIQSGSPSVDAGIDWYLGIAPLDYVGVPRPQGLSYDIGAYELVQQ
jgi:parallel beta-helix repeat protein